jgi:hypothetical protein
MAATAAVAALPERAIGWARRRRVAPNSAAGISLLLGLCAAVWFSAGTENGNIIGAVALCGCYLAARAAGRLARLAGQTAPADRLGGIYSIISEAAVLGGLALGGQAAGPGRLWPAAVAVLILVAVRETIRAGSGDRADQSIVSRSASAVLAMSAGASTLLIAVAAPIWGARTTLLILFAWSVIAVGYAAVVRATARAESEAADYDVADDAAWPPAGLTSLAVLLHPEPAGCEGALRPEQTASGGLGGGVCPPDGHGEGALRPEQTASGQRRRPASWRLSRGRPRRAGGRHHRPAPRGPAQPPRSFGWRSEADMVREPASREASGRPWPGPQATAARLAPAAVNSAATGLLVRPKPPQPTGQLVIAVVSGERARRAEARATDVTAACRDDGPVAWWLGRLVRGNLTPLPPTFLAVAAASVLAVLGLRDMPGFIVLTPLVVMLLLAGPGSSHPHDGRLDGLVPAVLQAGQYIYIAAIGFASGVPAPVTLTLCLVVAAWSADLAYCGAHGEPAERSLADRGGQPLGSGMGWEGRMLIVGLGAIAGLATPVYILLAGYLGLVICWKYRASSPPTRLSGR